MKFTLEINCDNAAFEADPAFEVARILRVAANLLDRDDLRLMDRNGNHVGQMTWSDEP
jgi:hypothetical protein